MKTLLFFAAAFGTLQAAAITQIVTCTYDGVTTTGTDLCGAGGPGVTVQASTSSFLLADYNAGEIDWRWEGLAERHYFGTGHTGSATATITNQPEFLHHG